MHPRYWSWFHQRCKNFEGTRTPLYPLYTWSYCISSWYNRCREHGKTGKYSHGGPKGSNSIRTYGPLDSQNGILNGIVAVKESCIFHGPHWMVLRFPRTSLVMVGRAASRCTGCHHCHYHSSKMMRTLDTNQRTKSQTCRVLSIYIPRPAELNVV